MARYVVATFVLAYLSVGLAPCVTAATAPVDPLATVRVDGSHTHATHAHHAEPTGLAPENHDHHGAAAKNDAALAVPEHGDHQCPHCLAGADMDSSADHSSCFVLDDLTNVAASQAKDAPQALAPSFTPAAFKLPPPLASPAPPPLRAAATGTIPLNVRHCVFLI